MMSKERLEKKINFSDLPFEKRIRLTKESVKKDLKENDYQMPKNIYINTKYLLEIIEQAERVQELEKKHKEYVLSTESNNYNMDVEFGKLYKQNKRYREAIDKAIDDLENECLWDAHVKLKALEGEE